MPKYTLISNARLIGASFSPSKPRSLLFRNAERGAESEIMQIGDTDTGVLDREAAKKLTVYNAKGRYMCPGFADMSVHICEPGYMYRERLVDTAKAAVLGGVTSMLAIPETKPAANDPTVMKYISESSKKTPVEIVPAASVTTRSGILKQSGINELIAGGAGALFCSDMSDREAVLSAMTSCAENNIPFVIRCASPKGGAVNSGRVSGLLRVNGIPSWQREIDVFTAVTLAKEAGCRVHISSVSTEAVINIIRQAKMNGVQVTCDTCPQYFTFYEDDLFFYGTSLKLNPPLAMSSDRTAVIEAIRDGTIDCIASDHTPWLPSDKNKDFQNAQFGMTGLQTLFPASYTALVYPGYISLQKLVALLSENPAKIIHHNSGFNVGAKADLVVFSTEQEYVFSSDMLVGGAENSPFNGRFLRGEIPAVFCNGKMEV